MTSRADIADSHIEALPEAGGLTVRQGSAVAMDTLTQNRPTVNKPETSDIRSPRAGVETSFAGRVKESTILKTLGQGMFAPFTVAQAPGKVVWFNFELARDMGFDVPAENRMTPDLHDQLIRTLSWKVLRSGEEAGGRPTITMYADKYGGDGVAPALGSARAGFLPFGNLFVKGVGHTPLFRHNDPDDYAHAHGGLNMHQGIAEAVFGEVNVNLFAQEATRILAIIDQGDQTIYPNGLKHVRAIAVRTGNQLRPGHILARRGPGGCSRLEIFVAITRATGQLATRIDDLTGERVPDINATMVRVIDDHARTAAAQVRWRIAHGALSTSNMQMDGGMLDINTERAHPRTAPIRPAHDVDPNKAPYIDYLDRGQQMGRIYKALLRSVPRDQHSRLNLGLLDIKSELDKSYIKHLEPRLLSATGLKSRAALRIRSERPDLARRFREVLTRMTDLKNPARAEASKVLIDDVSVVDIFNLLRNLPPIYFARPGANHTGRVLAELRPVYKGNRFHRAKKKSDLEKLAKEFCEVYHEVMYACRAVAMEHYGTEAIMQASITSRAAFENRPLTLLYRTKYLEEFTKGSEFYRSTGSDSVFREIIDKRVSSSLRNVDALLTQGGRLRLSDGSLELQIKVIDGIRYSIKARDDGSQTRALRVAILAEPRGDHYLTALPGQPLLSKRTVRSLRYKFTTDGWASAGEVGARARCDGDGRTSIECEEIPVGLACGELEGFFYDGEQRDFCLRDGQKDFRGYVFATPDREELQDLRLLTTSIPGVEVRPGEWDSRTSC